MANPCAFSVAKEKTWKHIFNTNNELSQNRTEKQIMPFKTPVNWLLNDIWCYLVIGCFDWKIDVSQQAVTRVYILKLATNKVDIDIDAGEITIPGSACKFSNFESRSSIGRFVTTYL